MLCNWFLTPFEFFSLSKPPFQIFVSSRVPLVFLNCQAILNLNNNSAKSRTGIPLATASCALKVCDYNIWGNKRITAKLRR